MNEPHKYRATDKMSDLICDNYSLLMVMSRFGLSLGFGDKSVKDVCEAQGVDYRTFHDAFMPLPLPYAIIKASCCT